MTTLDDDERNRLPLPRHDRALLQPFAKTLAMGAAPA
jgi:hypothetical protein